MKLPKIPKIPMMEKKKLLEIGISESKGIFSIIKKENSKKEHDFSGLSMLRQALSNEKARILDVIKYQSPKSIYALSKKLGRGFKAVYDDVKFLERVGFIDMIEEKTKNGRISHRPEIIVDRIILDFKI